MSIEKDLNRIATALEGTLVKLDRIGAAVDTVSEPAVAAAPVVEAPPAPPAPPAPLAAEAPVVPPTAPVSTMTPEQLNEILIAEFNRLGDRAGIDAAIRELGATSISDLPVEKYTDLVAKVKVITL